MISIEDLYREHRGAVRRILLTYEQDYNLIDELMHDVFVAAIVSNESWQNRATPSTWLCGIAKNIGRNHVRCAVRRVVTVPECEFVSSDVESYTDTLNASDPTDDPAYRIESEDVLYSACVHMPEQMGRAVILRYTGYSNPEVAEMLDTTEATIRSQISQSRTFFQQTS